MVFASGVLLCVSILYTYTHPPTSYSKQFHRTLEMTIDSDKKTKKKSKIKSEGDHKRKLEDTEELQAVVETKKDKKKKKKEEASSDGSVPNGSDEKISSKKIKKMKKNQEEGEKIDGSVQDCDGEVRETNEGIVVSGKDVNDSKFRPLKSFEEAGLPDEVLECCKTFDKPSPIQANSWRFLLEGRDFIGIAKTGSGSYFYGVFRWFVFGLVLRCKGVEFVLFFISHLCRNILGYCLFYDVVSTGKTLAFGVPAIMHVLNKKKNKTCKRVNPQCLVLSPTRELAQQVSILLLGCCVPVLVPNPFNACTICCLVLNKVQFDQ